MKQILILIVFWIAIIACAQNSNLDYSRKLLNINILDTYISKLDTSESAILNFIIESEKANTNFETRISKGPVEFDSIADTLLNQFGKSANPKILQILIYNK